MFPSVGKLGNIFVRNIGSRCFSLLQTCSFARARFVKSMFLVLETLGKDVGKLANIVSAAKMFLNCFGNIFSPGKQNFVFATMFPKSGEPGN